MASTSPSASTRSDSLNAPFIAADIGGTHARLALVRCVAGAEPTVIHYSEYICAEYPDLATILRTFIADLGADKPTRAALALAGAREGDVIINRNLPWHVSLAQTQKATGLDDLEIVNDFEALAHAIPYIDIRSAQLLTGKPVAPRGVVTLILGPGTGLGVAVRLPTKPHATVLATEGGHAAFAPGNELEIDVLRVMLKRWPYVDRERAISGPGLHNVYECICELHRVPALLRTPPEVTAAALANANSQAVAALTLFCNLFGSLVGDLVLSYNAQAVFLAGGIPARIRSFLPTTNFVTRFLDKGVMREPIEPVPVWLIDPGRLGLIGAAVWYRERCAAL